MRTQKVSNRKLQTLRVILTEKFNKQFFTILQYALGKKEKEKKIKQHWGTGISLRIEKLQRQKHKQNKQINTVPGRKSPSAALTNNVLRNQLFTDALNYGRVPKNHAPQETLNIPEKPHTRPAGPRVTSVHLKGTFKDCSCRKQRRSLQALFLGSKKIK